MQVGLRQMMKLLIVEDDLTFATMLKTWLKKKDFEVTVASSVARAIALLREETDISLVLSDLRLPDNDGLYLLDRMRRQGLDLPFIIMTHYAEVQNAVAAMKAGASDYIAKPVQPDILLSKINDALALRLQKATMVPAAIATISEKENEILPVSSAYMEGTSEAARKLYGYVSLVAPTPMSVL